MLYSYLLTKSHQGQYLGSYFRGHCLVSRGHCLVSPSANRLTAQRFGNLLASVTIRLLKDVPVGLRHNLFPSREESCKIWIKYTVCI